MFKVVDLVSVLLNFGERVKLSNYARLRRRQQISGQRSTHNGYHAVKIEPTTLSNASKYLKIRFHEFFKMGAILISLFRKKRTFLSNGRTDKAERTVWKRLIVQSSEVKHVFGHRSAKWPTKR